MEARLCFLHSIPCLTSGVTPAALVLLLPLIGFALLFVSSVDGGATLALPNEMPWLYSNSKDRKQKQYDEAIYVAADREVVSTRGLGCAISGRKRCGRKVGLKNVLIPNT